MRVLRPIPALALILFMAFGVFRAAQGATESYFCDAFTRGRAVMLPFFIQVDDEDFQREALYCLDQDWINHPRVIQWERVGS